MRTEGAGGSEDSPGGRVPRSGRVETSTWRAPASRAAGQGEGPPVRGSPGSPPEAVEQAARRQPQAGPGQAAHPALSRGTTRGFGAPRARVREESVSGLGGAAADGEQCPESSL